MHMHHVTAFNMTHCITPPWLHWPMHHIPNVHTTFCAEFCAEEHIECTVHRVCDRLCQGSGCPSLSQSSPKVLLHPRLVYCHELRYERL